MNINSHSIFAGLSGQVKCEISKAVFYFCLSYKELNRSMLYIITLKIIQTLFCKENTGEGPVDSNNCDYF